MGANCFKVHFTACSYRLQLPPANTCRNPSLEIGCELVNFAVPCHSVAVQCRLWLPVACVHLHDTERCYALFPGQDLFDNSRCANVLVQRYLSEKITLAVPKEQRLVPGSAAWATSVVSKAKQKTLSPLLAAAKQQKTALPPNRTYSSSGYGTTKKLNLGAALSMSNVTMVERT